MIVTAFDQHAIEAFEAGAVDYLLKPVGEEQLRRAVERARKLRENPLDVARDVARITSVETRKIVGRNGEEYVLLDADEILAFQAEGELVWIVTANQRLLGTQTLRVIEDHLKEQTNLPPALMHASVQSRSFILASLCISIIFAWLVPHALSLIMSSIFLVAAPARELRPANSPIVPKLINTRFIFALVRSKYSNDLPRQ